MRRRCVGRIVSANASIRGRMGPCGVPVEWPHTAPCSQQGLLLQGGNCVNLGKLRGWRVKHKAALGACGEAGLSGELVLDSEANQIGARFDSEGLHRAVLVELDRPRGDAEDGRDLLHAVTFRKELCDLSLAG